MIDDGLNVAMVAEVAEVVGDSRDSRDSRGSEGVNIVGSSGGDQDSGEVEIVEGNWDSGDIRDSKDIGLEIAENWKA